MNILDFLNEQPLDFFYLSIDKFLEIEIPELRNFYKISPESLNITLAEKNSGRLLSHPKVIGFIQKTIVDSGHTAAIIPFKPSAKIEKICHDHHWILVANPAKLNRLFEDKIKFPQICQKFNLPIIDFLIAPFSAASFKLAQEKFGSKLVIQSHFGWAGNSTFSASEYLKLSPIIPQGTLVKYSPYLSGYSLLNNACLTYSGLIQSPPALQYTGLKPLTQNPFTTVGRQWPCLAPREIQSEIYDITQDFGKILQKYNYRGFFGLDFLINNGKVFLLECNPRLTASFGFYTRLEINAGLNPLFLYHLAEFCGSHYSLDISSEQTRFDNPQIIGSEATLKNAAAATINKYAEFTVFSSTLDPIVLKKTVINHLIHETN